MKYFINNATSLFFALLIVLLITASFFSFYNIKDLGKTAERVNHTNSVKLKLLELMSVIKEAESGQRGFLLTGDNTYLQPLINTNKVIPLIFKALDSLLSDNYNQINRLQYLKGLTFERLFIVKQVIELSSVNTPRPYIISSIKKGKLKMDEASFLADEMVDSQNSLLKESIAKNNRNIRFTPIFALVISMLGVVLMSIVFVRAREESALRQEAIEALKQKNNDMEQQQNFVDAIFNASVDVISYLDKDLIFRKFNNAGVAVYGRSKEELIGKNFIDLYPHVKNTGLYDDLQKALNGELVHQNEYYSPPTKKYFELFLVPLKNSTLQIDGILMIAHDITLIVESKQLLLQQNLQLEQSNKELTSFSYIASHDLKEPLRKIQIFTKRISENTIITEKQKDYFNRILSASIRMQNLIDSLLNFSLANNTLLNFEDCDLNEILKISKNDLDETINEKNAVIIFDHLPVIKGIPIQLTQLFTNLLDNGIKYCKSGTQPLIKITTRRVSGKEIVSPYANKKIEYELIQFKDNGIGFEQEYEPKIFEIFQRLHPRHHYTGTGIGLAICKKIVSNHQGIISAESSLGNGASFNLLFPKKEDYTEKINS